MGNAFDVVKQFEARLCEYTGAPYCITTDSCTNALRICFERLRRSLWFWPQSLSFPRFTYIGVPRAAKNAGFMIDFIDQPWTGEYRIASTYVVDAARWLRHGMYKADTWTCLSFQATKHLPIGRGGAILCDSKTEADWFRRARFDGRAEELSLWEQEEFQWGIHAYLTPPDAARGLWLMNGLKDDNEPLPGTYPDLSLKRFL
jgi:dTDP-4-amino-4,6-dideoxygalactose transaminase